MTFRGLRSAGAGRAVEDGGWLGKRLPTHGRRSWEALVGFCIFILSAWMRFASCFRRVRRDACPRVAWLTGGNTRQRAGWCERRVENMVILTGIKRMDMDCRAV